MSIAKIYSMGRYSQESDRAYRKLLEEYSIKIRRHNKGKRTVYKASREARKPVQFIPHEMDAGYHHPEYKH